MSPALIMVRIFMIKSLKGLDFETWTDLVPAAVTTLIMTLNNSIARGFLGV
jgi:AGZA family xanthine/uracil permease-like MFS transporter